MTGPCVHCGQNHLLWFRCSAVRETKKKSLAGMPEPKRQKNIHVGAPACFALELAMQHIDKAFGQDGPGRFASSYVVGSVLERPDWRDVDVRMIMDDATFAETFPDADQHWEFDPRWLLLTVTISKWLSDQTGLPIDFQFQPKTHANAIHKKRRNAVGLRFARKSEDTEE